MLIFLTPEILIQITKTEKKSMGTVSVFTTGNYHCKPLKTDVFVIHVNVKTWTANHPTELRGDF